jgi:lipopolysaccharide biosynthesis protein
MERNKKVCVILHLYYLDLWEYFLYYLKYIDGDVDLYVSFAETNLEGINEVKDSINANFKNNNIYILPNRGMDVAPFLYILNDIKKMNKNYDCIVKLHSKKSLAHSIELGNRWRENLTTAIMGNTDVFNRNYNEVMNHPTHKMVSSRLWRIGQGTFGWEQNYFSEKIPDYFNYAFVGGTMFMVNFDLMMDWFVKDNIFDRFYKEFPMGYVGDHSVAHQLERMLGLLVYLKGFNILGV